MADKLIQTVTSIAYTSNGGVTLFPNETSIRDASTYGNYSVIETYASFDFESIPPASWLSNEVSGIQLIRYGELAQSNSIALKVDLFASLFRKFSIIRSPGILQPSFAQILIARNGRTSIADRRETTTQISMDANEGFLATMLVSRSLVTLKDSDRVLLQDIAFIKKPKNTHSIIQELIANNPSLMFAASVIGSALHPIQRY